MVRPRAKLQTTFLGIKWKVLHRHWTTALYDGRKVIGDVTGTAHKHAIVVSTWEHHFIGGAAQGRDKYFPTENRDGHCPFSGIFFRWLPPTLQ